MKKIARLFFAISLGVSSFVAALLLPILARSQAVIASVPQAKNWFLIAVTHAQTVPGTIGEMTTEVTGFATTLMPGWLLYVVFVLIAGLTLWLIGRAIRSMKH